MATSTTMLPSYLQNLQYPSASSIYGSHYPNFNNTLLSTSSSSLASSKFVQKHSHKVIICAAKSKPRKSSKSSSSTTTTTTTTRTRKATTTDNTQKRVLVPVGFGTEELEAVIMTNILRRAGAHVTMASVVPQLEIQGCKGQKLVADTLISSCENESYDLVVLPGGMPGSARLRDSEILQNIMIKQAKYEKLHGAISEASAIALDKWGLLMGVEVACHPQFTYRTSALWIVRKNVHTDGMLTTARGPGNAMELALSFIKQLYGPEKYEEILQDLVIPAKSGSEIQRREFNAVDWVFTNRPRVLVPIAEGSDEVEAVAIADVLRRASADVVVASVEEKLEVVGSQGVKLVADKLLKDAATSKYDLIILPGGMSGAERLRDDEVLTKLLKEQDNSKRVYGAICASPVVVLETHGLLKGKRATAHPSFSNDIPNQSVVTSRVVIDGRLITSRGPGTSIEFAIALVDKLYGQKRADRVAKAMVLNEIEYSDDEDELQDMY